jgi:hypothetical protein
MLASPKLRVKGRVSYATLAHALPLMLGGAAGCTTYSTLKPAVAVDCSVENAYDLKVIDAFDMPGAAPLWTSVDCAQLGATMTVGEVAMPDGPRCGSTTALEIKAAHNNVWGSLGGYNNFGPQDASAYQGIAFWARAYGATTEGFTVALDDPNTATTAGNPAIGNCTVYPTPDAGCGSAASSGTITDPATGSVLSSGTSTAPVPANACGNSYTAPMLVSGVWQLYTIPFSRFHQAATPNQVPNAQLAETGSRQNNFLLTSQLLNLLLRMPKEADMDLWIDNLAFYRAKGWTPGGDGGIDAPQM